MKAMLNLLHASRTATLIAMTNYHQSQPSYYLLFSVEATVTSRINPRNTLHQTIHFWTYCTVHLVAHSGGPLSHNHMTPFIIIIIIIEFV